jgi:muramoyltetrapeptide carboxypeptidase
VVAPASAPRDPETYQRGLSRLRSLYDVRTAWTAGQERGYLAAPDGDRAEALEAAISDPSIRGILCVRGGYGCLRLLPRLDWARARRHPTLLVGYSDVTALHLAYYARAGWTGLSGPVVTEWASLDDRTIAPYRALAEGDTPLLGDGELASLRPGTAAGPLLGGNLSVLTRLLGTPYAPDWTGAILVLEDVAESPYRIDRMLAHLQHAGVLDAVAGVVLGRFRLPASTPDRPSLSLEAVVADYFGTRDYPVATNLPYGHQLPRCSLPIGAAVRLSTTPEPSLRVEQALVAA